MKYAYYLCILLIPNSHYGLHEIRNVGNPARTRSASTSKGLATGIPIEKIMQAASWSNAKTFARFYNKPITSATTFGKNLLDNVHTINQDL